MLVTTYGYLIAISFILIVSLFVYKTLEMLPKPTWYFAIATISNMMLKRFIDVHDQVFEHLSFCLETLSYPNANARVNGFLRFLKYSASPKM